MVLSPLTTLLILRICKLCIISLKLSAHYDYDLYKLASLLARNQLLELPEELFWGIDMDRL